MNYDDCVRLADKEAKLAARGVVVQDTAWEGYENIPTWIMQGYGTMADEANEQFSRLEAGAPTHIFVQAGVGSMAGAVVGYFANKYPENPPIVCVVEADAAACLYKSAVIGDGNAYAVTGDLSTIMAGLACGEANVIGWDILKNHTTAFAAISDEICARGMRVLSAPMKGDPRVISGESGAAGFAAFFEIMTNSDYADLKQYLQLDSDSRVLCFSTEGDTDPEQYRRLVW